MTTDKIAALESAINKMPDDLTPLYKIILQAARAHLEQLKAGDDALKAAKRLLGKYLIAWGSANKDMQDVRQSEGYKDIDAIITALTPKGVNK